MIPSTATCQCSSDYARDNIVGPQHVPSIETSLQSNVPTPGDYKVAKKNMIAITTNAVTSMVSMTNFTSAIEDVNTQTAAAVSAWNARNPSQALPTNQTDPTQPIAPLFNDVGVENSFSSLRVMLWSTYCDIFYANNNKRPHINHYYRNLPCFNTPLLTYKNSTNEYCQVNLATIFMDLYNTNNNQNGNTLDIVTKIGLKNSLSPLTNLANFNGDYKAIDVSTFYVELADVGLVRWNPSHLNLKDARPNVFGGVLVSIEHHYNIYQRIFDETYLLTLKVPFTVLMTNWVSTTQYSRVNFGLTYVSETVTGLVESAVEDTPNAEPIGLISEPSPSP